MIKFNVKDDNISMNVEDARKVVVHDSDGSATRIGEVSLPASAWVGEGNTWSQVVSISGVTANSQVDLTPDAQQLVIFYEKDLTFVTENENGVVTVYVIGQKPANDYVIQVTISEVIAEGKIIGVTVGTSMSIQQIKEKINPVTSVNGAEADKDGNLEISNVMTDEEVIKLQSALQ